MKRTKLKWSLTLLLLLGNVVCLYAQNFVWAKRVGGVAITSDAAGSTFIIGGFSDTVDFDPGPGVFNLVSTSDGGDGYLAKLDAAGNLAWARHFQATGFAAVECSAVYVDGSGNIYVTGIYFGTADFDPGAGVTSFSSPNETSIFVVKLDAAGNFVWARNIGGDNLGSNDPYSYDVATDATGNVYVTGRFSGTIDFDPGTPVANLTSSAEDMFVTKLNSAGNYQWAKQVGATFNDAGRALTTDATGNVYVAGYFEGPVDFDPGAGTATLNSSAGGGYLLKLNTSGSFIWVKQVGGPVYSMGKDASNFLYMAGSFFGTKDFDPGAGVANLSIPGNNPYLNPEIFVAKWDTAGVYSWAKKVGGEGSESKIQLFNDASGNVYLSGVFQGVMDVDPGAGVFNLDMANGSSFMTKWTTTGQLAWAKQLDAGIADITADAAGNVYTTGYFMGTKDLDPGSGVFNLSAQGGQSDVFVLKLGTCTPVTSIVSASACSTYTFLGQTYNATGSYSQAFTAAGGCDSIVTLNLTLQQNGNTLTVSACDSYSLNSQTYLSSGTYTQTYSNVLGCDSIVTLQLTLHASSQNAQSMTTCDSFTFGDLTYLSSGVYNHTFTSASGCDSAVTLTLTLNHASSNALTAAACDSFTLNGQTYHSSGTYTQTFTNATGCDSIVTLTLNLNILDRNITRSGNVLTATQAGASYQWLNCDLHTLVPGATGQSYTATANGKYAVVVTRGDCSDTTACLEVTGLSVEEFQTSEWVQLLPNPAHSQVTILTAMPLKNAALRLVNILGQNLLQRDKLSGTQFTIDISNLAPGVYIVELEMAGKQYRSRLVKQ